ncbi:hypothetical protein [Maricaulis maris]|jgi:hypothetical protein|uniref:hypothetical protein n=1 Tax=Maricaulis maris TaxID=74318 RepID=UPI00291F54F7|nr:hypothetical protein MACH15_09180 [Maricaulis maris]
MGYFDLNNFMPHGMCYLWRPELLGMHVIADLAIALAYFSIPVTITFFLRRIEKALPFRWAFIMFGIFILFCGINHVMNIVVLWYPLYYIEAVLKLLTAAASIATAVLMLPLVPVLLDRFTRIETREG